jgi:hypothetical protein
MMVVFAHCTLCIKQSARAGLLERINLMDVYQIAQNFQVSDRRIKMQAPPALSDAGKAS